MKTEILMAERQQVEQALGESEQRYRRLLEATTDYIYTVSVEHGRSTATLHGPGCEAVTGYSSAEFTADPYLWYRVIHEEDREAVLVQANRILAGEAPPPLEHRLIHKRGAERWVRNTPIPHRDARGQLVAYDGLITDITSRKRAELLLAAEYAVTRVLSEADSPAVALPKVLEQLCQVLAWHHGANWYWEGRRLRWVNGFWRAPLRAADWGTANAGLTLEAGAGLAGRVWAEGRALWVPDLATVPELAREARPAGAGLRCGCAFPIRSNHEIIGVIELYSREVRVIDERMLETLVTVGMHIGQLMKRKQSEQQLRESEEKFRILFESSRDATMMVDRTGFLDGNPAALKIFGFETKEQFVGTQPGELSPPRQANGEDSLTASARQIEAAFATGSAFFEWLHRRRDGAVFPAEVLLSRFELRGRLALQAVVRDITERNAVAQRLEQAYARLARRDRILKKIVQRMRASHRELKATQLQLIQAAKLESLGTLAAGVAHEVKNPLQTILMGLDYLTGRFSCPDDNLGMVLKDMRDAVTRANTIIREMLALSAKPELRWELEGVNRVIQRSLLLIKSMMTGARVSVKLEMAAGLPRLPMDSGKLEQVFINIFINSVQAMPDGGTITVRTRVQELAAGVKPEPAFRKFRPGETLVVTEVQDTGTGLTDAVLARIFDPFFTTKPVGTGTGLGLSVARNIIDLHGGSIEIKNAPGCGALATVVLKARKENAYEAVQDTGACRG